MTIRTNLRTCHPILRPPLSGTPPTGPADRFQGSDRPGPAERVRRRLSEMREGAIAAGSAALLVGGWLAGAGVFAGLASVGHPLVGAGLALAAGIAGTAAG
ncbi:MAG TPA: hypothetical protein VNO81_05905, partial [Candidatus Nitrosotenuis sp.]|nr:hypothetical protein [Candidatus Nitrosotenuis sp.]